MSVPEAGVTNFVDVGPPLSMTGFSNPESFGMVPLPAGMLGGLPEDIQMGVHSVSTEGPRTNVHSNIMVRPLSTGAEKTYTRVPAFLYNPKKRDYGFNGPYTMMSLDSLNWSMRQAAYYQAREDVDNARISNKRRHTDDGELFATFPRTVEQFKKAFHYLGFVYGERYEVDKAAAIISPENSLFNICSKGEIHDVVNYWEGAGLKVGDNVGFRLVYQMLGDGPDRNWKGEETGMSRMSRNTPVLQLVPWHDSETGGMPVGGDFVAPESVVKTTNGKFVKLDLYQPAHTIVVGHVQRTRRCVQADEAAEAIVSRNGVEFMLRSYKTVDLILMPQASALRV